MAERAKPYVGVSGVGSPEVQQQVVELFDTSGLRSKRELMIGVKTLHKCQWLDQPWVRDDGWDLVGEQSFRGAAVRSDQTRNIAQAYFDQREVGDQWYRNAFLERMYARGEAWIDGIQFDSYPWHENKDLLAFLHETKERHPETLIYLQCHEKSMQRFNPQQLARILGEHADVLNYLLFDRSHGKGIRFTPGLLAPYIEEALGSEKLSHVGIALAGGLHGPVVREDLPELVAEFPDLSWDAEGKLHPVSDDGRMLLDMDAVKDYFVASKEVIG